MLRSGKAQDYVKGLKQTRIHFLLFPTLAVSCSTYSFGNFHPVGVMISSSITLSGRFHPKVNAGMHLQCTDYFLKKLITGIRDLGLTKTRYWLSYTGIAMQMGLLNATYFKIFMATPPRRIGLRRFCLSCTRTDIRIGFPVKFLFVVPLICLALYGPPVPLMKAIKHIIHC